jgi:hypothetical protein
MILLMQHDAVSSAESYESMDPYVCMQVRMIVLMEHDAQSVVLNHVNAWKLMCGCRRA